MVDSCPKEQYQKSFAIPPFSCQREILLDFPASIKLNT